MMSIVNVLNRCQFHVYIQFPRLGLICFRAWLRVTRKKRYSLLTLSGDIIIGTILFAINAARKFSVNCLTACQTSPHNRPSPHIDMLSVAFTLGWRGLECGGSRG
jgi:hypothetical protein